jgi:hypothetical protein
MLRLENQCCNCAVPGYPCRGAQCPNTRVEVYYCDECGEEIPDDDLYEVDGDDLCEECLKKRFRKVI